MAKNALDGYRLPIYEIDLQNLLIVVVVHNKGVFIWPLFSTRILNPKAISIYSSNDVVAIIKNAQGCNKKVFCVGIPINYDHWFSPHFKNSVRERGVYGDVVAIQNGNTILRCGYSPR